MTIDYTEPSNDEEQDLSYRKALIDFKKNLMYVLMAELNEVGYTLKKKSVPAPSKDRQDACQEADAKEDPAPFKKALEDHLKDYFGHRVSVEWIKACLDEVPPDCQFWTDHSRRHYGFTKSEHADSPRK